MTILHREFEWLNGIDARSPIEDRSEWALGYIRASDWGHPGIPGFSRYTNIPGIVGSHWRPFLTQLVPFGADANGVTYDTDQLFACFYGAAGGASPSLYGTGRSPGDTTNPLNLDYPYLVPTTDQSARESWIAYRATIVPAGASGTFQFYKTDGTPSLGDFTIASAPYARNLCLYLPAQTIDAAADPNPYMTVTWSGGSVPWWESVQLSVFCASAIYVPVPTTLDAAYTARYAHDCERGGIFGNRVHADRRRTRGTPTPWEPPIPSGLAAYDQAQFWLSGALKANGLPPVALSGQIYRLSTALPSWPNDGFHPAWTFGDGVSTTSVVGAIAAYLDNPGGDASNTVIVKFDGVTVYSAAAGAGNNIPISVPALPAHGTLQVIELRVTGGAHFTGTTATLRISPRRDIPYPFAMVAREQTGARLAAPGGYLPGSISDYVPPPNVVRLAAGVTHATAKSSFKPAADAWYQTKNGGTPLGGGSDDFGLGDSKQIDRGRTNQPYYIASLGDLSVYTPSPHTIASGGTDLTPILGNWWEWAVVPFPGAGSWVVPILCKNAEMLKRGLVAEWSATETTVIHPEGQGVFETFDEGASLGIPIVWAGSATTPPVSPVLGDAWVVLATATGAWAGHEGQWALWDDIINGWIYFTPSRGSYLINGAGTDWTWFDGLAWKAKTDPVMSIGVVTSGALTWGLSLRQYNRERFVAIDPTATVKWAAA